MLQGAGRVKHQRRGAGIQPDQGFESRQALGQQLAQVACEGADARRLGGIGRVIAQDMAVLFDRDTAARSIHHQRLDAVQHIGPPGVDVGAHLRLAAVLVVEVEFDCAAAPCSRCQQGLDTGRIQHPGRGAVDVGRHTGLHATGQHQHLAWVLPVGPLAGILRRGHFVFQAWGQQRAYQLAQLHGRGEQGGRQPLFQRPAQGLFARGPGHFGIDQLAADVDQMAVVHPAGAGAFAVAAGQATVEVHLGGARGLLAFQHLLHQVDTAARAIELITEQLVGRARRGAKTAMDTFAQNGLGGLAVRGVLVFGGELGLHKVW